MEIGINVDTIINLLEILSVFWMLMLYVGAAPDAPRKGLPLNRLTLLITVLVFLYMFYRDLNYRYLFGNTVDLRLFLVGLASLSLIFSVPFDYLAQSPPEHLIRATRAIGVMGISLALCIGIAAIT